MKRIRIFRETDVDLSGGSPDVMRATLADKEVKQLVPLMDADKNGELDVNELKHSRLRPTKGAVGK